MGQGISRSIETHFQGLQDPRRQTLNQRHTFIDILVIAICGSICGANDWVAVATFGKAKEDWLRTFLEIPHGIPSHDTFTDVFSKRSPGQFQQCFISWVSRLVTLFPDEVVAIDGKTLRHSYDTQDSRASIHMVSAWASQNSLVLGQLKTEETSNEMTAIPQLLEALELNGCIVTIDAMGCQKKIAAKLVEKKADYLLALKGNHPTLYLAVEDDFHTILGQELPDTRLDFTEIDELNHGRVEVRRCWVSADLTWLPQAHEWKKLHSLVMIESARHVNGVVSLEQRDYLSSASRDAAAFLNATRQHWSIEHSLHWVLDVAFREDDSRIRKGHGAENFAMLRHIALNLLKQEQTTRIGTQNTRLKAGWDDAYLEKVLAEMER